MVEIPTLYELACRAFNGTDISNENYQSAFMDAMSRGEKPSLIIFWVASEVHRFPYQGYEMRNPFIWRIAYMDEECFGLNGPLEDHQGKVTQVAVIEDWWEDYWGRRIDSPELCSCRNSPFLQRNEEVDKGESRNVRMLYPVKIVRKLEDWCHRDGDQEPIEAHWFEDAELPLELIDGVPESFHYAERRRQREDKELDLHFCSLPWERDYLQDLNSRIWKNRRGTYGRVDQLASRSVLAIKWKCRHAILPGLT